MFEKYDYMENVELKNYSTMKVGGLAKFMVFPRTHLELKELFEIIKQENLRWFILGNGSNVLFDDEGFDGVVVNLKHFDRVVKSGESVRVGAGVNLFALNIKLKSLGLGGLEWSYGIPGTLGGLLVMNGGCYGHEICEFVEEVTVFDSGKVKRLKKSDIKFEYRHSDLNQYIILSAKLKLKADLPENINQKMTENFTKKKNAQPYELPSLGSVFKLVHKNDEIIYPAKLIDNLGLKGVKIGGAEISQKHAGFIVNTGEATSEDIIKLIEYVECKLLEIGVKPEREIIILK